MTIEIKVPPVGESITEAQISSILTPSGSHVDREGEIVELETDKVNQVVYAPEGGVVTLTVSEGDTVKVGQVIGTIDPSGVAPKEAAPAPKAEVKKEEVKAPPPKPTPTGHATRQFAESYVQKMEAPKPAQEAPPLPKAKGQKRKKMSGLRKTIAKRLVEVKNQTAMLTTFNEIDMSAVMAIRAKEKEKFEKKHGVRLGFMSFFINAVSAALKAFPEINAFLDGDEIVYNDEHNISIGVATDKGLTVPVIRNCAELSYPEIEQAIVDYAKKARDGKIAIEDLQGGTFTITNGGVFGSLLSTPILNPPQSGILGMHNIVKRPIVVDDEIVIRPMMYIALSYDHRIVDGKEAVSFLVHIKENLEDPARLLLDF